MKKYYTISEVSKFLDLKKHVIRYWDSTDPFTNQKRISGISIKSKGGTRYFNNENINKLKKLKNLLYENDSKKSALKFANKMLSSDKKLSIKSNNSTDLINDEGLNKSKKIQQILDKMRLLLKNYNM